jgi:hypothetical protein
VRTEIPVAFITTADYRERPDYGFGQFIDGSRIRFCGGPRQRCGQLWDRIHIHRMSGGTAATHGDASPLELLFDRAPMNAQLSTDMAQGPASGVQVGCSVLGMLRIPVIEATQAIQFYMSALPLCPGSAGSRVPCGDNTVPLVAEKPTVLRLYVTGATPGALVGGLVTEPVQSGIYGSTFMIAGVGGMTATALAPTRTNPSTTLQVSIKPHAAGTYRFDVIVTEDDASGKVVATASSSITLQFVERRRQRIRLVRIHYTGTQNGVKKDVAPRTVREFWDATDYAQRVLPIPSPGFEIVKDSVEDYDGNFTRIDPSAHDTTWPGYAANRGSTGNLLNILDRLVGAESLPADVVYVGIYPPGVRMSAFAGWAVGRWIISDLDGTTLAHELAHKNGVPQHAPCGNPDNVDPNFPDFPSFSVLPAASIGEVGFDWSTLKAYDPQSTFDLMSYCSPKWISPYNYRKVFDQLPPLPPPPPTAPSDRPDRSVFLSFVRFPDRWVVVDVPGRSRFDCGLAADRRANAPF